MNSTKRHKATKLLSLGFHHNVFFSPTFTCYSQEKILLQNLFPIVTLFSDWEIISSAVSVSIFINRKPFLSFILKSTKNKTRVTSMETLWSVQLWLHIWHFSQVYNFLFISSQIKIIAKIAIWILNTGWKQPLLVWHS